MKKLIVPSWLDLKINQNDRGQLIALESKDLPFKPKRVFWIWDVPKDKNRGDHAHYQCHQLIICIAGEFRLLAWGQDHWNLPIESLMAPVAQRAFYAPPLTWVRLTNFVPGSIALVLVSHTYDSKDYIHDFSKFKKLAGSI